LSNKKAAASRRTPKMKPPFDAIIIGAGAAGLAAARDLSGAGKKICILEGRDRIGGRIWTIHPPDLPLPIELGAEFIHGEAQQTFAIVEAAALLAYELPATYWLSSGGRWRLENNLWGAMYRLRSRIPAGAHDISFADFLKKQRGLSPRVRTMALTFAEGYEASHADRISAASMRPTADEREDQKQFRIANGYDALIHWLRAGLDPQRSQLRLSSEVTQISWRPGEVEVHTVRGHTFRGVAAIVTIPVGVWKAPGGIRFDPPLHQKQRALDKIEVGHVVKIVFRFRERFWDAPDFVRHRATSKNWEKGLPLNFLHADGEVVPTWWTTAPVRAPLLTGWAGGHAADALLAEGGSAMIDRALDSLASTFAVKRRETESLLDSVHMHDWQADRFSRGAYSYAGVGGSNSHEALAKPIAGTLFFAGEATNSGETGTVAGAISTGRRAAKQVISR
jgi:monoamine oxidase